MHFHVSVLGASCRIELKCQQLQIQHFTAFIPDFKNIEFHGSQRRGLFCAETLLRYPLSQPGCGRLDQLPFPAISNSSCGAPPTSISTLKMVAFPHSNYLRLSQRRHFLGARRILGRTCHRQADLREGHGCRSSRGRQDGGESNTEDDLSMMRQLGVIPE